MNSLSFDIVLCKICPNLNFFERLSLANTCKYLCDQKIMMLFSEFQEKLLLREGCLSEGHYVYPSFKCLQNFVKLDSIEYFHEKTSKWVEKRRTDKIFVSVRRFLNEEFEFYIIPFQNKTGPWFPLKIDVRGKLYNTNGDLEHRTSLGDSQVKALCNGASCRTNGRAHSGTYLSYVFPLTFQQLADLFHFQLKVDNADVV